MVGLNAHILGSVEDWPKFGGILSGDPTAKNVNLLVYGEEYCMEIRDSP